MDPRLRVLTATVTHTFIPARFLGMDPRLRALIATGFHTFHTGAGLLFLNYI
jgi:hypothetical protein